MAVQHCKLCDRKVCAERQIGVGTLILAVLTAGSWLIAIPFYEERCPICKCTEFEEDDARSSYRGARGRKVGFWLGSKLRRVLKH